MTDSINKIGAEVAKALRELEKGADALDLRRDAAQSKLRQVWDALERGEIVNGCTTKKAWASFAKVDIRTCQYTLKGKRNRSVEVKKRSANHVVRDVTVHVSGFHLNDYGAWVNVEIERERRVEYTGKRRYDGDWSRGNPEENPTDPYIHNVREIHGDLAFDVYLPGSSPEEILQAVVAHTNKTLEAMRLPAEHIAEEISEAYQDKLDFKAERKAQRSAAAKKGAAKRKKAAIPVDEQKAFMKKFKAAKRLAKHYITLFKEYDALSNIHGKGDAYNHLLELYPNLAAEDSRPHGILKINLPLTEKAFFADHEKAMADFNRLLQEGIDKGWMTTEPRKKGQAC
jgi:hypothetical protein